MCKLKKLRNLHKTMKKIKVLKKVHQQKISAEKAYDKLYNPIYQLPRAHFIKFKIKIKKKGWGINMLLGILFLLPVGMWFVRWVVKKAYLKSNSIPIPFDELMSYVETKGLNIEILNDEFYMKSKNF